MRLTLPRVATVSVPIVAEACARRGAGFSRFLQLIPGEGESQTTGKLCVLHFFYKGHLNIASPRNYRYVDTGSLGSSSNGEVNDSWKGRKHSAFNIPRQRKDVVYDPAGRASLEAQSSASIARQQTLAGQSF